MAEKKRTCSICGREFEGPGNNAYPVNDGTCCDRCNVDVVLPARINRLTDFDADGLKDRCADFLAGYFRIRDAMVATHLEAEMRGKVSEEFEHSLFTNTTRKMVDHARGKLDDDVMQGILFGYLGYVGDDLEIILWLYHEVTGKDPVLVGLADLDGPLF